MNQFNLLPPEIIELIFKKVNFDDLINLRTVDKRFKVICEQLKIKQLSVNDYDYVDLFWFYTNKPTYFTKKNKLETSKFLNYISIFRLDKYLRRLSMRADEDFNVSILNGFKLLEQLQIIIYQLNDNYKLSLENLRMANIHIVNGSNFKLTLNTNQLFAFKSCSIDLNKFIFNYPAKILFYETNNYVNYEKIREFINLQYLKINRAPNSIDSGILNEFVNLKILDLDAVCILQVEYDNLKRGIISILNERKNLKRSELEIYFCGVKLINQNQLVQLKWSDDYKKFNSNVLEFQIQNYDLLKDNCSRDNINYCDLVKLINKIPSSSSSAASSSELLSSFFIDKFPFIHKVKANDRIDNEDQFLEFLITIPYLTKLELTNCELTQSFYEQLINLVYLNNLQLLTIEEKNDLKMNFDFILNLEHLIHFQTNQQMFNNK